MRSLAALSLLVGALLVSCSKPSGAETGPAALVTPRDPAAVVARVGGSPITERELMVEAKAPLAAAERQFL